MVNSIVVMFEAYFDKVVVGSSIIVVDLNIVIVVLNSNSGIYFDFASKISLVSPKLPHVKDNV